MPEEEEHGTYSNQCATLHVGDHVMIEGRPCKLVKITPSDDDNVHLVGLDIFTGNKYEEVRPSTDNVDVPIVNRCEYNLTSIDDDGYLTLQTQVGSHAELRGDVKLPEGDLGDQIKAGFDNGSDMFCIVLSVGGEGAVESCRQ